jgi:Heterokaryon incompatibility protein (HET)
MRRFLTGPRRTPEPEPAPPITPAESSLSAYFEPPNDGTLRYNLLRGEREFRVLVLLPGSGEDEIACVLDNVFLDDWLTHYEALSYMWGPAEPVFPVSVDGATCFVRKNLLNALKALRLPTESRLLFIDALCINMGDVPERNRMVANMSQIYQRATKVLVWLGDADEVSDFAFDKVNQRMPWADLSAPLERATASTLTSLFNRPYWRRVWILQEILSGYNLEVYCGTKHSPWMQFISVMRFMDFKADNDPEEHDKSGIAFAKWCVGTPGMAVLRLQNGQTPQQHIMADLLEMCRKCESGCYDIRDRIYGLVSISTRDEKGLKIEPDYSKSQAQLCIDTFLAEFSNGNAQFRVSTQALTPQNPLNNELVASQRAMQILLEEPLWNKEKKSFDALLSIVDEAQSHLLRNSFSKASIRGLGIISWTGDILSASSPSKILFAHLEIDTMYKNAPSLRLPQNIAKLKNDVAKLSVREYHSTEQLRVRYAWSPQSRCFRTESTYRDTNPPYFLGESSGECRLFSTRSGMVGIASAVIQPEDILCAVEGAQDVYMIMRPRSDSNRVRIMRFFYGKVVSVGCGILAGFLDFGQSKNSA